MQVINKLNSKLLITCFFIFLISQSPLAQYRSSVNFQFFYDCLSPYGNWIEYPKYGYVWHPHSTVDFHPYRTKGHWVWTTEYEWFWVSDYEWGWAPFHYGRWFYDNYYGWIWIPANEWSPAWVVWRYGSDFYGWSPLGPDIEISILYSSGPGDFPYYYWSFVPQYFVTSENVNDHCYHVERNQTFLQYSQYILAGKRKMENKRQIFVGGPSKKEIEERSRKKINPYYVNAIDLPGKMFIKENRVNIYKPMFEIKDKKIAKPSIIQTNDKQNNQGEVNKDVLQNQIKREDPNMKKPIFNQDQKDKINKEKDFEEMTNPARVPLNKPAEINRKVENRYSDKWEQIRKVPDRPTAPPVNLKPIQVPKSTSDQLKKVPVKKDVIKRVP